MNAAPSLVRASLLSLLAVLAPLAPHAAAQEDGYRTPPPELASLVEAPLTPVASVAPDRARLLLLDQAPLPSIEELARDELRLAGLRIDPARNGPSRSRTFRGMVIRPLPEGSERPVAGLPPEPSIRNVLWSPDGRAVAFTHDAPDRVELWVADLATARARRLTARAVNDALSGTPLDWLPDGSGLVVRLVPEGRGPVPVAAAAPRGPVIQQNEGGTAPVRTYQDLLSDPRDEALFEHFGTAELARVGLDGSVRRLLEPRLVTGNAVSPDGRLVLVETLHRPFSYLVPASRFPTLVEVLSVESGRRVAQVADLPLREEVPAGFGSVPTGPRSIHWRSDAPSTLAWVEAQDEGDASLPAAVRDRLFVLGEPFTSGAEALIDLPLRFAGVDWGNGDVALVHERWRADRTARTYLVRPDQPAGHPQVVFDHSYEDAYADPGEPLTRPNESGHRALVLASDGRSIYMAGAGATPEGNRPFLRRLDPASGETVELFRSDAPWYEEPVALLGDDRVLTQREAVDEPPNYFIRTLGSDRVLRVTDFAHPYPALSEIQKEMLVYEREDGVQLTATLYLPAGYDAGRDGPLPTFLWAYPREFKSADAASQITDSPYRFNQVSYWGAVPWVTRGYAVLDDTAMPVIGEGDEEPNDTYVDQLVMSARAAIEEGARRGVVDPERVGVGGHSYGAFMTANLLAHSDLFRAGIARSGAYNRTLTPFGFQAEERLYWEAPDVYYTMSPFMHADKVNEPLLLIHGIADNNSGTFPIQSERFYAALKGMGKTTRLVMLPHESHGYRARESLLHMLWEMDRWLETYVKGARRPVSER